MRPGDPAQEARDSTTVPTTVKHQVTNGEFLENYRVTNR